MAVKFPQINREEWKAILENQTASTYLWIKRWEKEAQKERRVERRRLRKEKKSAVIPSFRNDSVQYFLKIQAIREANGKFKKNFNLNFLVSSFLFICEVSFGIKTE